jgi:hypothetical protein
MFVLLLLTWGCLITVQLLRGVGAGTFLDDEDILIPRITFLSELAHGFTL